MSALIFLLPLNISLKKKKLIYLIKLINNLSLLILINKFANTNGLQLGIPLT